MNGKGSKPRPIHVPRKQYEDNWDAIFGKKKRKTVTHEVFEHWGETVRITKHLYPNQNPDDLTPDAVGYENGEFHIVLTNKKGKK